MKKKAKMPMKKQSLKDRMSESKGMKHADEAADKKLIKKMVKSSCRGK